jgi:hypothetical protein
LPNNSPTRLATRQNSVAGRFDRGSNPSSDREAKERETILLLPLTFSCLSMFVRGILDGSLSLSLACILAPLENLCLYLLLISPRQVSLSLLLVHGSLSLASLTLVLVLLAPRKLSLSFSRLSAPYILPKRKRPSRPRTSVYLIRDFSRSTF